MDKQMTSVVDEIRELNLSFMLLAQSLIRKDLTAATARLGITKTVAERIGQLAPEQMLRLASRNMMLFTLKFDDQLILGLLSDPHVQGSSAGDAIRHDTSERSE